MELVSCREAKDSFRGGVYARDIVVYDDSTADPARLAPSQPLHVVLESLRREGKDPIVLKGRPGDDDGGGGGGGVGGGGGGSGGSGGGDDGDSSLCCVHSMLPLQDSKH